MGKIFKTFLLLTIVATAYCSHAQTLFDEIIIDGETVSATTDSLFIEEQQPVRAENPRHRARRNKEPKIPSLWDLTDENGNPLDSIDFGPQELLPDPYMDVSGMMMTQVFYLPATFDNYDLTLASRQPNLLSPDSVQIADWNWAQQAVARDLIQRMRFQQFVVAHPELVPYNMATLPEAPKDVVMEVDPTKVKVDVSPIEQDRKEMSSAAKPMKVSRIHWLQTFDGSLQFSQAYISPNWYQGGKSNINGILALHYNIRLNPAFHPNLIFENNFQYRLGANNAPDDEVHNYNITEDMFQYNMKFGLRAWKRWFYSITAQFKTQLLNHYGANSDNLTSAFMSPAELNIGVGMTYNYNNPKNTIGIGVSLSPLSYNLKVCLNDDKLKPAWFGIEEGKKSLSDYGSSAEITFRAKIAWNIDYNCRLFAFTNYEYTQGDWENTITFNINKFLSTKLFWHMRYQSNAEPREDTSWHKWQMKEILSIGFSYKFSRG